jgi:hypothetical protein
MITGLATELETRLIPGLDSLLEKPLDVPALLKRIDELLCECPSLRQTKLDAADPSERAISRSAPGYLTFPTNAYRSGK